MGREEFWQQVYMSALNRGATNAEALASANQALADYGTTFTPAPVVNTPPPLPPLFPSTPTPVVP